MRTSVILEDWGIIDYKKAWDYQKTLFQGLIQHKMDRVNAESPNYLLFCEHPHVYTLGKNGHLHNLQLSPKELEEKQIAFYKIQRGGDITYHGYGQWVIYPILDLDSFPLGLRKYIFLLEEVIIQTLAEYNISTTRQEGAAGVWLNREQKICAIGVKASRMVTMHGLALNVNTDLNYFNYINPCGFVDKKTTSMAQQLHQNLDMAEVKNCITKHFAQIFEMDIHEVNLQASIGN